MGKWNISEFVPLPHWYCKCKSLNFFSHSALSETKMCLPCETFTETQLSEAKSFVSPGESLPELCQESLRTGIIFSAAATQSDKMSQFLPPCDTPCTVLFDDPRSLRLVQPVSFWVFSKLDFNCHRHCHSLTHVQIYSHMSALNWMAPSTADNEYKLSIREDAPVQLTLHTLTSEPVPFQYW